MSDSVRLAASACSWPRASWPEVLSLAKECGFDAFELFSEWAASRVSPFADAQELRDDAARHGLDFCALHLPTARFADENGLQAWRQHALAFVRLASEVGAKIVLFKAADVPSYLRVAPFVLDACESLNVTPVLTNHTGTALEKPEQVMGLFERINDARLKTLLEVGHYHSVGVHWREAAQLLGETVAHVHIKDQIGAQSVPFGEGEIDLAELFAHLQERDYRGACVLEMEVRDEENTGRYLTSARHYVAELLRYEVTA